jgi:hypothetical protein
MRSEEEDVEAVSYEADSELDGVLRKAGAVYASQ